MNYTHLEDDIFELFTSIGIANPSDLKMGDIAARLGVEISYRRDWFSYKDDVVIVRGSPQEEWQSFGHEICHHLRHCGNQLLLPRMFVDLQEWQADHFAYHFCVPTFMLEKMELVQHRKENIWNICNTFNVDYEFAKKRLEMYRNKQKQDQYRQRMSFKIVAENRSVYSIE